MKADKAAFIEGALFSRLPTSVEAYGVITGTCWLGDLTAS